MEAKTKATIMSRAGGVRLRVETGKATFSPVQFNTFDVGSVSIEMDLPAGADAGEALAEMSEVANRHFGAVYAKRLADYLKALRYNDTKLREAREAGRG